MKKQPYESPKFELQWLLSDAVCAGGNGVSVNEGFGEEDGGIFGEEEGQLP